MNDVTAAVEVLSVSPYKASVLVNQWIADRGVEKRVPPQMMYNYTTARVRKDKKPLIPITDGKILVQDLAEWFERYAEKNL